MRQNKIHDFTLADQDWIGFNFIRTGLGLKNFTVRSSLVWWSLLLDIRCLQRHNMTSCLRLQANVLEKFVDAISILFYMPSP